MPDKAGADNFERMAQKAEAKGNVALAANFRNKAKQLMDAPGQPDGAQQQPQMSAVSPQQVSDEVKVYKRDGASNYRTISIKRDALEEAKKKGWSSEQPPAYSAAPGFREGFKAGINPFHQQPADTPDYDAPAHGPVQQVLRGAGKAGEAMTNAPEIKRRMETGDYKGAIGETAGVVASFAGPELLKAGGKALKGAGLAVRGAEESGIMARATERAAELAKKIKVNPDISRFATRYTQPLVDALNGKFELVHKALEGKAFPIDASAASKTAGSIQQLFRRLLKSEIPAVQKLGEEFVGRTALDYREGEAVRRELMRLADDEVSKHWAPQLRSLAAKIDEQIDRLANTHGVGQLRDLLRKQWGEVSQLTSSIASKAKVKQTILRPMASVIGGVAGDFSGTAAKVGGAMSRGNTIKVAEELEAAAYKMAQKLGVDPKLLVGGAGGAEKAGSAMKGVGSTAQGGNALMRALSSLLGNSGQASTEGMQVPQQ